MKIFLAGLAALIVAAPLSAGPNLVLDSGFETDVVQAGGYNHIAGGATFGGAWHVTGVDILHINTTYRDGEDPILIFKAHSGLNSLDLTGTGNSGPESGIYQDIATQAGTTYTLSFFVGRATNTGSAQNDYLSDATMRLAINGGAIQEFVNSDTDPNLIDWRSFSTEFVATGTNTRIHFFNGLGNSYLGLDDVSLRDASAAPEASTWAMLIGGMFAMGGTMRCRPRVVRIA